MKFYEKFFSAVLMISMLISALCISASAQTLTPNTGDNSMTVLWVIIGVVAVAALAVISRRFGKHDDDEDDGEAETEDKTEE